MTRECKEWRVGVSHWVVRRVKRYPQLRKRLDSLVEELKHDPYSAADKLLRGRCKGMLSRRLGDYRVIYRVIEDKCEVLIECVGPRERVYEECC
ncbi:hypothetical protein PYJP_07300 [Pyrofollis japonicus]|uniref:type II toxin-antitoxin system RelE family toxin n=1 Tax=Pyrofollis japonicus TaxID=3060460 RepID=UPI00295C297E|nr:type II toxin-antitoxin system RelE/ParE family toxin [Pyrofollis japonicus]BEP17378.1 hypothetical protein PYJP_07300 [Pyrofollis japonicus]